MAVSRQLLRLPWSLARALLGPDFSADGAPIPSFANLLTITHQSLFRRGFTGCEKTHRRCHSESANRNGVRMTAGKRFPAALKRQTRIQPPRTDLGATKLQSSHQVPVAPKDRHARNRCLTPRPEAPGSPVGFVVPPKAEFFWLNDDFLY
jgi:hypothetical protein